LSVTLVSIPEDTTIIAAGAFQGCVKLATIVIPESVRSLDNWCFRNCVSLKRIKLPDGLKVIEQFAFDGCASLESIKIPASVVSIGVGAFFRCTSLPKIMIPDSVVNIGNRAFLGATLIEAAAETVNMTPENWCRLNWIEFKKTELRLSIVSCIKRLSLLEDEELEEHITHKIECGAQKCVRFMLKCGEKGLVREIIKFMA
jgi:hypothetical protein